MGPPLRRIDRRDPGAGGIGRGAGPIFSCCTCTDFTPGSTAHLASLAPVRFRVTGFSELVFSYSTGWRRTGSRGGGLRVWSFAPATLAVTTVVNAERPSEARVSHIKLVTEIPGPKS